MEYYVYILHSSTIDKYYIGQTSNIDNRLKFHNSLEYNKIWTKRGIPWKLVYMEKCDTRSESLKREKYIKRQKSRSYIEELVRASDPDTSGRVLGSSPRGGA